MVIDMKQLLDEVEQNIINYQNWGPSYLPKSKTEAEDNVDTGFDNSWYHAKANSITVFS